MTQNIRKMTIAMAAILTTATSAWAMDVEEIVAKANEVSYYQGDDGRAKVNMTITDDQGRERTRAFVILRKDNEPGAGSGEQKFYVFFSRPADVNKTAFLVWKHMDKDDDRWLYLPGLDLVKRIAASDKRSSFVGSNFFYEDVSGRNPDLDTHALVQEDDNYYVLESTPKDKAGVEFASYKSWIHKATFLPIKIDYINDAGEVYRTYEALNVEEVGGYMTVTASKMTDVKAGSSTSMTYSDVAYDMGLEDDIFSERYLRNPPRNLLR
ncbi:MAG: outer membrane lipoprotein-sorting protein [Alphaproteobacteria bacterium]|nr:MAG: outer membrane lipoprotein-sorting protein [Alphaproteobacteria bacterium]